ncbi:MAG: hypothetical protein H8E66_33645 [Planctomycetes bacterium]|nr:hypothetical protein [Planctomycetota bacterium]
MSELQTFRAKLARLRSRRAFTRWQTVIARGVMLDVIALFVLLLADFSFRLEVVPRSIVIAVVVGVVSWRMLRHFTSDLLTHETIVDIALLLEQTNRVDSDLVAALQFDTTASSSVGSRELQRAVVDRTARISETLDFRSVVPKHDARRAARHATLAVVAVLVCWLAFPDHARAFWNRLWLGDAKYPTRTQIEEVAINGRTDAARVVEGEAVMFRVKCSGVTPDKAIARLRGVETGDSTSLVLKRIDTAVDTAIYAAEGPMVNEPLEYSLRVGDAEAESRSIALIRRPIVELTIEVEAPVYMQREKIRQHEQHAQVMEGSTVRFAIRCTNRKRLKQARFEIVKDDEQDAERESVTFSPTDDSGTSWHLDAASAGLTRVANGFQFRVAVLDEDGLGTYHPIEGAIRVKQDLAPVAALASLHQVVMPNARPSIAYTVEDDFGIGAIVMHARRSETRRPEDVQTEPVSIELHSSGASSPMNKSTIRSEYSLDLSPLKLVKRDKVLVWLEVTDYRGTSSGVSTNSESIELEVMDERAVLEAILRSDADAEQILTDAIEKELGLETER